ncbi:MAG: sulfatase, partial [bacterium]|nr:sulfatase [bacterium]
NRVPAATGAGAGRETPQGVILIVADTLRSDHLDAYGYPRPTAPVLSRLAAEGVLFRDCIAQASWTKVSMASILSSLYPTTHGVALPEDRLPSSARTLAEVYRDAGYATLSLSSIFFNGRSTNLHQGFEEFHEADSLADHQPSKTSREYMDRLLPWLETHREVPFFVLLHVFDPHDPFRPYRPYDTRWTEVSDLEAHRQERRRTVQLMEDRLHNLARPLREELLAADVDPEAFVRTELALYDGSIRAMDAEIGRLVERLKELGLDESTLVAFTSDHGEEFLEHGRHFHGQSVYGELLRVPLVLWWPGVLPAG